MHDLFCQFVIRFTYEGGGGCHACLRQRNTISIFKVSAWDYPLSVTTLPDRLRKKRKEKKSGSWHWNTVQTEWKGSWKRANGSILHCSANQSQSRIDRMTTCRCHSHNSAAFGCWKRSGWCIDFFSQCFALKFSSSKNWVLCHVRALRFGWEHCILGECFFFFFFFSFSFLLLVFLFRFFSCPF